MKLQNVKEKMTGFCKKVGKKNLIIAAAFVVVAAAIIVGVSVSNRADGGFDYSQGVGMQPTDTGASNGKPTGNAADTYFSSIQVNRQRTRDEALEVLQGVVDNEASTATAKEEALASINKMAKEMEAESNIETLVVAKGFEECVAVIAEGSASIIVRSDGLLPNELSQIKEIVYEEAGIDPIGIKIIEQTDA